VAAGKASDWVVLPFGEYEVELSLSAEVLAVLNAEVLEVARIGGGHGAAGGSGVPSVERPAQWYELSERDDDVVLGHEGVDDFGDVRSSVAVG
jgi:hypothetical protein